jgi:hypothetical protein
MRRISLVLLLFTFFSHLAVAQVVSAIEIKDPELRALQVRYMDELKQLGADILSIPTEYPFYLSRRLDLDEQKQKAADQRSIRFDRYEGKTVLEITGNYYAAYSTEKMTNDQRARATFTNVVLPILKVAVPRFQNNPSIQAYALEISHHVMGKVMGVGVERPENLVVILPQKSATKLVGAKEESEQQAALLQGKIFLNAQPVTIWVSGEGPQLAADVSPNDPPENKGSSGSSTSAETVTTAEGDKGVAPAPKPVLKPITPPEPLPPARDTSPQALAALNDSNKDLLAGMVKDLDSRAHFVPYAQPSFVAFRNGAYLELSINTALTEASTASRYKLAALAFDDHIAHLIRPVLGYFKGEPAFDGIGFSTNLHLTGKGGASAQAVEFFFPFSTLRCYERYDCTGQQLLDAGTVLINGERVNLDLQIAEGGNR